MFLGNTQLEQIIRELKLNSHISENINLIIKDIQKNNIDSKYLDFTDQDNQQICIQISKDVYIYSQQTYLFYDWNTHNDKDVEEYYTETYNLALLTKSDIEEGISGFYPSLDALKKDAGEDWKQIAIECIFENEALSN